MSADNVIEADFSVSEEEIVPEAPSFHAILQIWRDVLQPAEGAAEEKVTAQWANRICGSYREIAYADMNEFKARYFGKLEQLKTLLAEEIATDADCLSYDNAEDDVAENSAHYKNLLRDWQLAILQWELDWDCTDPTAAVEIAAIAEVHKMFFGQEGLTAFLDQIGFEFTDADQAELRTALEELREGAK